jgi:hypothetical protein
MIKSDQLRYITGAYLSGRGYYSEISPEVPDVSHTPDVLAVKPRATEVTVRLEKGAAPVGIIYMLSSNEWMSAEDILRETGYERNLVYGILDEARENGWVKSRIEQDGEASWTVDKYKIPASECMMIMCAAEKPSAALNILGELSGCYDKGYLVFPYQVDERFLHDCSHHGTGVMVFDEKTASFLIQLPAKRRKITKLKAYASLCEKTVINHNVMIPSRHY